jgi:hypothetical protein
MASGHVTEIDLTPPPFAEGLADWSRGDGTPASPSYEDCAAARVARGDPAFGDCLELRKLEREQRLRYMGELPIPRAGAVEVRVRLRALRGPLPSARIAAWPGGLGGRGLTDLPARGPLADLEAQGAVCDLRLVIARGPRPGPCLVWDARALYAHVGLDLLGPCGGVVRIADLAVRVLAAGPAASAGLPGFAPPPGDLHLR